MNILIVDDIKDNRMTIELLLEEFDDISIKEAEDGQEAIDMCKKENFDRVYAYIGTQANKLPQAVEAMQELMNNMPVAEKNFEAAKEAALKQIAAQRITKSNIFWNYERLLKRGIDYDNREEMYDEIQTMTMEDISEFFDTNVQGQDYSVAVIGNKNDVQFL